MLLLNLVSGVENSPFILIKDCYEHSGFALFKAILNNKVLTGKKTVELFCYEYSPAFHLKDLDAASNVHLHDGYTDPLKWNPSWQLETVEYYGFDLNNSLKNICQSGKILMIDALSHVLLNMPVHEIYKTLNSCLRRNVSSFDQIVACIHSDMQTEEEILKLEHLASSILSLSADFTTKCTVLHKKSNGKILKEVENYSITESFIVSNVKDTETKCLTLPDTSDSISNLTFNLHLKDDERTAREHVVLPYTKRSETVEGTIYYEDEEDFEDPDDDLDI